MAPVVLLSLALSVVCVLLLGLWHHFRDPLRDIPGPRLARWSRLWLAYHARRGRRFRAVHEAHQRYGAYVRVSPSHVSVADATAIPVVYGHLGAGALPKSQYYDAFVAGTPSVFSVRDNKKHAQKRALMSHAFSVRSLHTFEPLVHTMIGAFVHKLDTMCNAGNQIDMMQWFNYLTFDIISDLAFGVPLGMVERGSDIIAVETAAGATLCDHAIQLVQHREHLAAVLGTMPILGLFSRILPLDPFFTRGRVSSHALAVVARQGVRARLATGSQRRDILHALIASHLAAGTGVLGDEQVQALTAEAVTILIAGTHTAASSMAAILHYIRCNDRVYAALMAELDTHVADAGDIPTYEKLRHLPYLQATITEGLRLHATNAIGLPRSVPPAGVSCGDRLFPEGTEVSVPAWTIQHDEAIWGDPHVFRPERWLDPTQASALRRHMLIFGAGPRTCLGKHLANMEMLVVLASLLLQYDITLASRTLETHEGFQHQPVRMVVSLAPRRQRK